MARSGSLNVNLIIPVLMFGAFDLLLLSRNHLLVAGHDPAPDPSMGIHSALRHKILHDYDRYALPTAYNQSLPVDVTFQLSVISYEVDDIKMALRLQVWYRARWRDKRLAWDPADHGNISKINLQASEIWLPDITLYNEHLEEEGKSSLHTEEQVLAVVSHEGSVLLVPVMTVIGHCDMDFTNWPLDEQICRMKFGSWTQDGSQLNLLLTDGEETKSELKHMREKGDWAIEDLGWKREEKLYPCCPDEVYISVLGSFKLTRARGKFENTLINPVHALVVLTLASFFVEMASKMAVTVANVAIVLSLLMYHTTQVPSNVGDPLIFDFLGTLLVLQVVNIVWTCLLLPIVTTMLLKGKPTSALIGSFRRRFLGPLCCCCLPASFPQMTSHHQDEVALKDDPAALNITDYIDPHHLAASAGTSVKNARQAAQEQARDRTITLRILELLMLLVFVCVIVVSYSTSWPSAPRASMPSVQT